ncbi:MAG: type II toxin-antitoxin system HigB family toxin [Anaerolineae bacterium]|nr:type II toxin-antitoxin system HigB family toxin [Anaerolineae bacterium]
MRIVGRPILDECARKHADVRGPLRAWCADIERASWKTSLDIKACYATASIIGGKCVVFNIKGNSYRIVVKINYEFGFIEILFADTHNEYDKTDIARLCGGS